MNFAVLGHYGLAGLSVVALVAINIWGVENTVVNTALISVISATAWGGVQRGIKDKDSTE
ncbi:MAG TPA: hypothetical protein VJM50_16810 [Pyrinomonadaceae bacterium]|nr:hypothetical protein [Pyrinomonadaceae bacterium]